MGCCITTLSLCALLLCVACSTGQEAITKIEDSPLGAVSLRRITDRSFQAAHPIKIDSSTITLVLSGILIRNNPTTQNNSSGYSDLRRIFSGSEIGYFSPFISESLRKASPDQQIEFRIGQVTGILYAYGRSLYVTLAATGFANRTVSFIPESAQRPNSYKDVRSTDATLVIDYELLAMLPLASLPSASAQTAPPPTPSSANGEKADSLKRDAEIEALRKELQEIKKQLAEQDAQRARSQPQHVAPQQ